MRSDHHRVFMYTPGLSVSNQKVNRQRRLAIRAMQRTNNENNEGD
jgi:hypothetical protein